ncbi:MAG: 4-hydroxy-3-methylbut-2-enyl diphosphate reductase [Candidatus Saganbacteria bacterium]|nr:4-hydroxy-3-methylbut-2-enyl diphosphate reductase [Candidatus Saganbacteria bacterium]
MEVILSKYSGFCEGVERAYRIALDTTKKESPIYILGDLVHNTEVVNELKVKGIVIVRDLGEIPQNEKATLMISAHGVGPGILEEAKKKGLKVLDTTCPWVRKAQKIANDLSKEGYQVIIVGDKDHTEVRGLLGWAGKNASVISDISELEKIPLSDKIGILSQTTQPKEKFNSIVGSLIKKGIADLKAHNTICDETAKRQEAAVALARDVDIMLVVGDVKSANTKRLTELCAKTGTKTYQIHTASELDPSLLEGVKKIGVTAGASTPESLIMEVLRKLKSL